MWSTSWTADAPASVERLLLLRVQGHVLLAAIALRLVVSILLFRVLLRGNNLDESVLPYVESLAVGAVGERKADPALRKLVTGPAS